ncbi:phosphoglycerate dehydrogenase [Tuwongella immobilis]|uniref:D-3-phosphoglycerate dehydrogenase n=1 Tax=Tuwongella immobilis TaxID=692036 RepID=A0A6C2YQC1_9BACT|nr:phosphoglycerate dehydrogenase [Tuwongella immobilis]VIP03594.1 d-3-phosphoglycerate dehydrogenase : D-3-phosphoglycerate dehydrogenase OS=Singulisphaera acidiphila (strain ATCC BAA-1392 / DSM 18658 / VKM B-2454 / MOB10) GN=Sinac_6245 PE=3 SV=1: 2-Hacid_dh: 2-Hacid_dh_C: ACT [Tuwongella immobilis]VTS04556.1 d-3-phosphoglycerate dehydrogenase : D-3-phosphoglycerate dehydrogenase OS=Singulisphaera acidiphila (strain ATCC BAA-1392 / DSM 18658 / VKM B-2454 / MOB10) GN=Sinac_6245 PE=3 SV=1: 2-Hacid
MPRVLIADKLDPNGVKMLEAAGIEIDNRQKLKGDDLIQALQAADGVIVRSDTKITADLLESPGKLRAIVRAGVGVDTIDVSAATRKGIVVMNTPGGNTISAAEHTIALMMSLSRLIPAADASMKAGKWERGKFLGTQVAGKTIGVIGLGRIGLEVARRAIGLDMKVVGFDPLLTPERAAEQGIESVPTIHQMLPRCDFLSIHIPLNDQTRNLISARELAMMPKTARLLNVARGGIIDEVALSEALKNGVVAGAALDVFEVEPIPTDSPLLKAPNVVLTPHLGASTYEAQDAVAREAAQLLINFLTKGEVQFAVNMAAVDRTEMDELRQYVDLARRLGMLHSQMATSPIQHASILYRGDLARNKGTRLLTAAFTAGLLESGLAESVNIVNAELFARERGIQISESRNPKAGDFNNLMQVDVTTSDGKTLTVSGTLFGNQYLRLVQIGQFRMDSFLEGTMMLFTHRDIPGLIGYIGTIFGSYGVNIAQMTVGRSQPGGEAIAAVNLDSQPPEEAIREVRNHAAISHIQIVRLPEAGVMPHWFG